MLSYCDFDISMIENVYVAGGIGSGINMANAINIGMFPDIPVEMYHYVGNTSLAGAYAMLCSTESVKFKSNVCETEDKCGIKRRILCR